MVKWNAQEYHRSSAAQQSWARELIAKLSLTGNERLLDIGCGDGKVTAEIADILSDGSVVGVDKSEDMIGFARAAFPPDSCPNLSFAVMDASALAFDAEYDVVFSNATLHWVVDHGPVLQGVSRALKPGGRCLLQMGGRGNADSIIKTLTSGPVFERWGGCFANMEFPYGFYAPEDYSPWLENAGLRPLRLELIPRDMAQPGADGLAAWIRTTWMPYTNRIPEEQRESFIADVVDTYLAAFPLDEQGLAHVPMQRLEVEAVKVD